MAYNFTNKEISDLLRNVAAVYQIKNMNQFQIIAYENASGVIDNLSSDVKTVWEQGDLDSIPGLGKSLMGYLDELFRTGKVKHFEEVTQGVNKNLFKFLKIPGVGPKTAVKLAEAEVSDIDDLEEKIKKGKLSDK
jgi:DNA polymerase (family 10)